MSLYTEAFSYVFPSPILYTGPNCFYAYMNKTVIYLQRPLLFQYSPHSFDLQFNHLIHLFYVTIGSERERERESFISEVEGLSWGDWTCSCDQEPNLI